VITLVCWLVSVAGTAVLAVLGRSAAVPDLPGSTRWPPYSLSVQPSAGVVLALGALVVVTGAVAAWRMLTMAGEARGPAPRRLLLGGGAAVLLLSLLPPTGADLLSYLAYGQEAAAGVDPYLLGPRSHGVPQDAITAAVDPPWQRTPSVYGPAFTLVSRLVAALAHGDGHLAATLVRLLFAAAFVLTGVVLHLLARDDPQRRRAAAMWSANPLLLFTLVAGAHVDVLVAACAVCSLALVRRLPVASGALLGLAAAVKVTGLVALPGLVWAVRGRRWSSLAVLAGLLAVAVPWFLDARGLVAQLHRASGLATPAAPWRAIGWLIEPALGHTTARGVIDVLAGLAGLALVALLLRRGLPPAADTAVARAAAVTAAFAVGWLLTTPYVLPWYDAVAWAPLALVGASFLDRVVLVHTTVLLLAFLPGRDVPLPGAVDVLHRTVHSGLSPAVLAVLVVAVVRLAVRRPTGDFPERTAALGDWVR
jgi:alpha-1,6-mannosyltransferase